MHEDCAVLEKRTSKSLWVVCVCAFCKTVLSEKNRSRHRALIWMHTAHLTKHNRLVSKSTLLLLSPTRRCVQLGVLNVNGIRGISWRMNVNCAVLEKRTAKSLCVLHFHTIILRNKIEANIEFERTLQSVLLSKKNQRRCRFHRWGDVYNKLSWKMRTLREVSSYMFFDA